MTKEDLKAGMVVTYRNGRKRMVFKDCYSLNVTYEAIAVGDEAWLSLQFFNDNLTSKTTKELDIVQVEAVNSPFYLWSKYDPKNYTTIWEREVPKEMTVAEIEATLGYRVKIVG